MDNKLQNSFDSEDEAIELGKVWMQNSRDIIHDFGHAQRVAHNAIKVFEELRAKNEAQNLDKNLILLASWWHDCYKATKKSPTIKDIFIEGKESAVIAERELKAYVKEERLKRVLYAIENHQKVFIFFWRLKKIDPLLMVIFEADGIDGLRRDRYFMLLQSEKLLLKRIFHIFLHNFLRIFYFFYPKSEYFKQLYWKNTRQDIIKVN